MQRDQRYYINEANVYFAFDEIKQDWAVIDSTGREKPQFKDKWISPAGWKYFSIDDKYSYDRGIFSDSKSLYYPKPSGLSKFTALPPAHGDISGLAVSGLGIITIEKNGEALCNYSYLNSLAPEHIGTLNAKGLPSSANDGSANSAIFMFVAYPRDPSVNWGYFVVTKSERYWHIYNIKEEWKKPITDRQITEVGTLPIEKEIIGFVADTRGSLYLNLKNEGIRKYRLLKGKLVEENRFDEFNKMTRGQIQSISIGKTRWTSPAIYAVAGDDRVFRLTTDGELDYQIELSE